jgi:hypothetical protein
LQEKQHVVFIESQLTGIVYTNVCRPAGVTSVSLPLVGLTQNRFLEPGKEDDKLPLLQRYLHVPGRMELNNMGMNLQFFFIEETVHHPKMIRVNISFVMPMFLVSN